MVNKSLIVGAAILVVVFLVFMFVMSMTGNVITGTVVRGEDIVENELFRIDDFGSGLNKTENMNDTQNSSGSR